MKTITLSDSKDGLAVTISNTEDNPHISSWIEMMRGALVGLTFHPDTVNEYLPNIEDEDCDGECYIEFTPDFDNDDDEEEENDYPF